MYKQIRLISTFKSHRINTCVLNSVGILVLLLQFSLKKNALPMDAMICFLSQTHAQHRFYYFKVGNLKVKSLITKNIIEYIFLKE